MTKHRAIFKAIPAAILLSLAGLASAGDTQNLTVSATVNGVCKFSSGVQTLSFGAFDPSDPGPIAGTGAAVTYKCTKGTTATGVTAGNGLNYTGSSRAMKNSANADVIPYTLTISGGTQAGTGFGSGQDLDLTVEGEILAAGYENVSAGSYSDTVLLTLTP